MINNLSLTIRLSNQPERAR